MTPDRARIAYFSMEIGLDPTMPTYSGGLGVLAGDTVRAAADLYVPMVAVTLLHRKGYFYQRLDRGGWQTEEPANWAIDDFVRELPQRVELRLEDRVVRLRAWRYDVVGVNGFVVPVFFLDADLPENDLRDRQLTHCLYGGDGHERLCQEVVLGIGGVRMLRALGLGQVDRYHMNEGHAALLVVELLSEQARASGRSEITRDDIDAVRARCVFTTHTPVPAGHDKYPLELVEQVIGPPAILADWRSVVVHEGLFNLTYLALGMSRYVNGVAKRHGEVAQLMFARYAIDAITNGVHAATWACAPVARLFDRYMPGWQQDNCSIRGALSIPRPDLWDAHRQAKRELIGHVNRETNAGMDVDHLTLCSARRAAAYKRLDLIFDDLPRLRATSTGDEPIQLIFAGKAHPRDDEGKQTIRRILQARDELRGSVRVAYLENYDMALAKLLTSGADVWLNTPQPPMEASGTSGMKAALNGVPSLSVLDGWWIEGCIEGKTGWAIGTDGRVEWAGSNRAADAASLYVKLENDVRPLFYRDRDRFIDLMLHAVALNGSFFNTHRMLQQYVLRAYFREDVPVTRPLGQPAPAGATEAQHAGR
jgi:starch phosphorylase